YGLVQRDGRDVGIVPIFFMDVPMDLVAPPMIARTLRLGPRRFRYQPTLFVGSPCADEGSIGLLPGITLLEAADAIQDAVAQRACEAGVAMTVWKDFPDDLSRLCERRGLFRVTSYPGTRLNLACGDFEGYARSLSSSHRHNLMKKLR